MITGGFIIGYELSSPFKHYRIKHPLGMQYLRDEQGRIHPMLADWVWGTDPRKHILVEKAKVITVSDITPALKQMFVEHNARNFMSYILGERRRAMMAAAQNGSEMDSDVPVENQRFPGEVNLTEEEQINRVMKFLEFNKDSVTFH